MSLKSLRGKVVVLDFWAFWCGPCIGSIPHLKALYRSHKSQGLVLIGVHCDEAKAGANAVKRHGINYPDTNDVNGKSQAAYGIMAYPTVFVLDKRGRVRFVDPQDTEQAVTQLLREKGTPSPFCKGSEEKGEVEDPGEVGRAGCEGSVRCGLGQCRGDRLIELLELANAYPLPDNLTVSNEEG